VKQPVRWATAESVPERAEVFRLQGLPAKTEPSNRIVALYEAALAAYVETAEPQAVLTEIPRPAFAEIYRGEGRNAAETPLEAIFPRADRLILFAATVGPRLSVRIGELFARNQPALGAMLDSVASAAADRLADLLCARALAEAKGSDAHVLAYSPGYCGWHVSGQRALFAALGPEEIGITLNASCLMDPLKSISGVLVAGRGRVHRFTPAYPFCADCRDKPCRARLAALPESGSES
jgi:hypothetical protein